MASLSAPELLAGREGSADRPHVRRVILPRRQTCKCSTCWREMRKLLSRRLPSPQCCCRCRSGTRGPPSSGRSDARGPWPADPSGGSCTAASHRSAVRRRNSTWQPSVRSTAAGRQSQQVARAERSPIGVEEDHDVRRVQVDAQTTCGARDSCWPHGCGGRRLLQEGAGCAALMGIALRDSVICCKYACVLAACMVSLIQFQPRLLDAFGR